MDGQRAKLFKHGGPQAVRLPADLRFDCDEVYVSRDPFTGDVILSKKPRSRKEFFALRDSAEVLADFMADRGDDAPQSRKLFGR